jgi:hypothetical protein
VVREVREETGVEARVLGVCAVRSRRDGLDNDTYVLFLLEPLSGEPRAEGRENDEARYFGVDELDGLEVTELSRSMGKKALANDLKLLTFADDFDGERSGRDPKTWRLFR